MWSTRGAPPQQPAGVWRRVFRPERRSVPAIGAAPRARPAGGPAGPAAAGGWLGSAARWVLTRGGAQRQHAGHQDQRRELHGVRGGAQSGRLQWGGRAVAWWATRLHPGGPTRLANTVNLHSQWSAALRQGGAGWGRPRHVPTCNCPRWGWRSLAPAAPLAAARRVGTTPARRRPCNTPCRLLASHAGSRGSAAQHARDSSPHDSAHAQMHS